MIRARGAGLAGDRAALAATLLVSLATAFLLSQPRFAEVWRSGAFFDPDDAMRAVQLRDLLAGQGWFDLVASRLDPPNGQSMHWSRVVDLPLAGLLRFFAAFLPADQAERAMRLAFPVALLAALLCGAGALGALLSGPATRLAAIWLVTLSGPMFIQFAPGRIDHHAPQIVTLVAALYLLLDGLDPGRAARLAPAAALMALSMAISLENLPFFVVLTAAPVLLFLRDGAAARARLLWFGGGALAAFPLFYAATVPPGAWRASACDAFSVVHLAAALAGALALMTLGGIAPRLASARARGVAAAVAGLAALAPFFLVAPHCLGDPLGGVDPLVRSVWLDHVDEMQSLRQLAGDDPAAAISMAAPVFLGLALSLRFARAACGTPRRRWLVVAATIAVGAGAGALHMRVFSSVTPIAMVPLAAAAAGLAGRFDVRPALRPLLAGLLALPLSPVGLALALAPDAPPAAADRRACMTPEALAPLAQLPPARVLGVFELGAHILAHSGHAVFAAPYHRNNHGNRLAADIFLAPPERAEALARAAGVELIVWCARATGVGPTPLARAAPGGLAAMLARGETPPWLERRGAADAALLVFAPRRVE